MVEASGDGEIDYISHQINIPEILAIRDIIVAQSCSFRLVSCIQ